MLNRCSLALAITAACLLMAGCRSSELFDTSVTTGRVAGELNIIGPVDSGIDLQLGLTRQGRVDTVTAGPLGRVISAADVNLANRVVSYDFTELPIGSYNVVLFSESVDGIETFYRSGPVRLSYETPERTGLSGEASLTGPGPWGTASGALYLSGVRPADPMLELFVEDSADRRFHYDFNAWDAGFGVLYFSVGGLAYGEYGMGIADPPQSEVLGRLTAELSITKALPDAGGLEIWSEYPDQRDTGDGHSLGGTVVIDSGWPVGHSLAVIAVEAGNSDIGTSPIFHIAPQTLDDLGRARFFIGSLSTGEYAVKLYALDFLHGNHRLIGELETMLVLDEEQLYHDDLFLRGSQAGIG